MKNTQWVSRLSKKQTVNIIVLWLYGKIIFTYWDKIYIKLIYKTNFTCFLFFSILFFNVAPRKFKITQYISIGQC